MKSLKVLWQTSLTVTTIALTLASGRALGASFSGSTFDPGKIDSGIPGFVGPDGLGKVTPNNFVNPLFVGWATGFQNYLPAPRVLEQWQTPQKTLGEVTAA